MSASPSPTSKLIDGISLLTADFFIKAFEDHGNENIFFSAFSLSSALAMTCAGAKGTTLKEMLAALRLDLLTVDEINTAYRYLLSDSSSLFNSPSGHIQLDNANRVWVERSFPLTTEYLKTTQSFYNAKAESANFKGAPEQERIRINKWVEDQTKKKIHDLIPAEGITSETPLVITNAIYFKAGWKTPFDKTRTSDGEFTLLDGSKTTVSYMHCDESLSYTHQGEYKAIENPYTSPDGRELSMVFILPEHHGKMGLEKVFKALRPTKSSQIPPFLTQMFATSDVRVSIPRFKMEFDIEASAILKKLGMRQAFTSDANFSGISLTNKLAIGKVFHKAFVDVNEEGTEAAASTAVVMLSRMMYTPNPKVLTFQADRPFVFLIWDRTSKLILSSGLVNNPNASSK